MPFPILKLPYGDRQRLSELSTPTEVYDLQLAVGDNLNGLLPLKFISPKITQVLIHSDDITTAAGWFKVITNGYDYGKFKRFFSKSETDAITAGEMLYSINDIGFRNPTMKLFNNPLFERLYLKDTKSLTTDNEVLPMEYPIMLKKFASKMHNLTNLEINCDKDLRKVQLSQLLTLFPKLEKIHLPKLYRGWVQDILRANKTDFTVTTERNSRYDNLFSYTPHDMHRLLNNRCFIIAHCISRSNKTLPASEAKIKTYLESHLRSVPFCGFEVNPRHFLVGIRSRTTGNSNWLSFTLPSRFSY